MRVQLYRLSDGCYAVSKNKYVQEPRLFPLVLPGWTMLNAALGNELYIAVMWMY